MGEVLQSHQIEAVHWSDVGRAYDEDAIIMEHARLHGYVVLTEDIDFGLLLNESGATYPSVLQLRTKPNLPEHIGDRVLGALRQYERQLELGALITFDPQKLRARTLPIHR